MRTFALLFAFVPVILAFAVNGPGSHDWVFRALLLIAAGVEICKEACRYGISLSETDIKNDYSREFRLAACDGRDADAKAVLRSVELFIRRGAA